MVDNRQFVGAKQQSIAVVADAADVVRAGHHPPPVAAVADTWVHHENKSAAPTVARQYNDPDIHLDPMKAPLVATPCVWQLCCVWTKVYPEVEAADGAVIEAVADVADAVDAAAVDAVVRGRRVLVVPPLAALGTAPRE